MSRNFPGSWEGPPNFRWTKMVKGKRLRVTCNELGLPKQLWTKLGSASAAKEWLSNLPDERAERDRELVSAISDVAEATVKVATLEALKTIDQRTQQWPDELRQPILRKLASLEPANSLPVPSSYSFDATVLSWNESKRRGRSGKATRPGTYANIVYLRKRWSALPFLPADVRKIDEGTVSAFAKWVSTAKRLDDIGELTNDDLSDSQKFQHCLYFRAYVHWLYAEAILDREPRNLSSCTWGVEAKRVRKIGLDEVRGVLTGCKNDFHRMYALLVLNTGAQNTDIGRMRKEDIVGGVWTRKRGKTERKTNTPTVSYTLWPETMALLERFRSEDPVRWLLSSVGTPLYDDGYDDDGKPWSKDLISQQWGRAGYALTLDELRKVPAQVLEDGPYAEFVDLCLGHAAGAISTRHYAPESMRRFALALEWLRTQILGV